MNFFEPWTIAQLPKSMGPHIERLKLKQGKGYVGIPSKGEVFEVGFCPFCRKAMVNHNGCPHVVFFYDMRFSDYLYLRQGFEENLNRLNRNSEQIPLPYDVKKSLKDIELCHVSGPYAFLGAIWGYSKDLS